MKQKAIITTFILSILVVSLTNCKKTTDIDMVFVEGGEFIMGSDDVESDTDEQPLHKVVLSDFYIGKYEVTQKEYLAVIGKNPAYFKHRNRPVECVSYYDAQRFINKLNSITGKHYRLPTEAEWEYAARGGNKSNGYKYSGDSVPDKVAWFDKNSDSCTHPVGKKQPNELGIYDMSGNVYEWCSDFYGSYTSSWPNTQIDEADYAEHAYS